MKPEVAITLLTSLLLFLFGYTGISKLLDIENFRASLSRIPFIEKGAAALALAVPMAELVVVLLLFFPATRLKGLYGAAGMLSLFSIYLIGMLWLAPQLPCSCGGVISGMGWWAHLGMNGLLIAFTVIGIRKLRKDTAVMSK